MYFIRPKSGLIVIDPKTNKPIPTDGYWVIKSEYWDRRLRTGEVERIRADTGEKVELDPELLVELAINHDPEPEYEPKRPRRRQKAS